MRQFFVVMMLLAVSGCSSFSKQDFSEWLAQFKQDAREQGISEDVLHDAFDHLDGPNPDVLDLDHKQPEKTTTFTKYSAGFLTDKNIRAAKEHWQSHKDDLDAISKGYSVPAPYIIALWSIESRYGERQGNFEVIRSLTTLAYDGRRSAFFRAQLMDALHIVQQEHIPAASLTGSWAGAMGQTQFMPSSYLKMAVDFDGDGKRDIWHNDGDALASIGNYLHQKKWDKHISWGMHVQLPPSFSAPDTKTLLSVQEWNAIGVTRDDGTPLPTSDDSMRLVIIDDDVTLAYLVTSNYDVIMDWNRSVYFATTVGLLADAIGKP